jgi:hypothetical protein
VELVVLLLDQVQQDLQELVDLVVVEELPKLIQVLQMVLSVDQEKFNIGF